MDNINLIDNSSATAEETTVYEPYGEVKSGGTKSKFQYTGQEKDLETGLNYYGARYYNSHIHRFTQADTLLPDPYDPQQLNRYAYVRNNPIKYTDPTGNVVILAIPLTYWVVGAFLGTAAVYTATPQGQNTTKTALTAAAKGAGQLLSLAKTGASNTGKSITNTFNNSKQTNQQVSTRENPGSTSSGSSPKGPNMNPLQKIAPAIPLAGGLGNTSSGKASANQALGAAETWLGKGYNEIAPGVFRSYDKLRQFRMTKSDISSKNPHVHFESIADDGKKILENSHVDIVGF